MTWYNDMTVQQKKDFKKVIKQMIISVIIIILANIMTDIFDFWIYRSVGFGICGLMWIVHPVLPNGAEVSKRTLSWTRFAGVILILIGVFTRVHI